MWLFLLVLLVIFIVSNRFEKHCVVDWLNLHCVILPLIHKIWRRRFAIYGEDGAVSPEHSLRTLAPPLSGSVPRALVEPWTLMIFTAFQL